MTKRLLFFIAILGVILSLLVIQIGDLNDIKNYIRSLKSLHKTPLKVAALGRHDSWVPRNIRAILEQKYRIIYVNYLKKDYDVMFVSDSFGFDIKNIDTKDAIKIYWTSEAYIPDLDDYDL